MTELLYYQNNEILEFESEIVSVSEKDRGVEVILKKTAFYPEGGGQPADKGTIEGLSVVDVQKKDGIIYHYLEKTPETENLSGKSSAVCIIDPEHRLDYMQQHTGQHIISAAMMRASGVGTVSVRQGSDYTAIETDAAQLSDEELKKIEDEANRYIRMNAPINAHITDEEGLKDFKLRRPTKYRENIRLIEISSIDCVACGGVHLKTSGEVGLIKYIYQEKIRGNVRTFWKIGKRAYDDYNEKTSIINSLNEFFSARQFELTEKAAASAEAAAQLRYRFHKLEEEHAGLYASIAAEESGSEVLIKVFENREKGFIEYFVRAVAELKLKSPAFIFNRIEESITWAVVCNDCGGFDFNDFKSGLLPLIDGKGGGKAPIWQGIAKNPQGLEMLIDKIRSNVK